MKDSGFLFLCIGVSFCVVWIVVGGKEGKVEVSVIGILEYLFEYIFVRFYINIRISYV